MRLDEATRQRYLAAVEQAVGKKRYRHTLGVEKLALELAGQYGVNEAQAQTAAILHDFAKKKQEKLALAAKYTIEISETEQAAPELLHGKLAAAMAREQFGIEDADVLRAIAFHTTGRPGMSALEKVIYLADLLEENRDFEGVEALRALAREDLDAAMLAGVAHVIAYLARQREKIDMCSVAAYNWLCGLVSGRAKE